MFLKTAHQHPSLCGKKKNTNGRELANGQDEEEDEGSDKKGLQLFSHALIGRSVCGKMMVRLFIKFFETYKNNYFRPYFFSW